MPTTPGYVAKLSDGKAPVLQYPELWSTHSLPKSSLTQIGSICKGSIELFNHLLNWK